VSDAPVAEGRRVSWVELYFDLIFVFAVGQAAHVMVAEPHWSGIGQALGLFFTLWWTWIGFVVLYNRHGEDRPSQRLFVLAGTLPCAVAAIETHSAAEGHGMVFAFALAGARLVLALAFAFTSDNARRVAVGYAVSAVLFVGSAFLPTPWRFALWAFALIQEAGFLLLGSNRRRPGERRGQRGLRGRAESVKAMFSPPTDPTRVVDAAHLAERFGLMMIILLGEIVVSVVASAAAVPDHGTRYWSGLLAGLVLAGALWWIYFNAAAPISEYVLRASGGNPSMAYGLYAGGHLTPAFALLVIAAGNSLALSGEAAPAAWFVTGGLAAYLLGTRAVVTGELLGLGRVLGVGVVALTVGLALLEPVVSSTGVVVAAAVWAVAIGAYVSWRLPTRLRTVTADPLSYFGPRR
jgi:low temperature requirement protein LtrA